MKHSCGNSDGYRCVSIWYHLRTFKIYRCLGPTLRDSDLTGTIIFKNSPGNSNVHQRLEKTATSHPYLACLVFILHAQF